MAAIGIGAILLLLFLLGCTLAVIIAVGAAVVHGRFALAAVIGGGAVAFVVVAAILLGMFATIFNFDSHVVVSEPSAFKTTIENVPPTQIEFTGLPQVQSISDGSLPHGASAWFRLSFWFAPSRSC